MTNNKINADNVAESIARMDADERDKFIKKDGVFVACSYKRTYKCS